MQLKKALLASAIAALSTSAVAMQSMDDEALSATTGQDGLTVTVTPPAAGLSLNMAWHDIGGFTGATGNGAVLIGEPDGAGALLPFKLVTGGTSGMQIDIDAAGDVSGTAGSQPGLRVAINFVSGATISTGDISVATSAGPATYALSNQTTKIFSSMDITLGSGTTAYLYLGNELDTKGMISLATTITGGINIANFAMTDADNSGSINAASIKLTTATSNDLTTDINIDATLTGLSVDLGASASFDVTLVDLGLGSTTPMGDVQIKGLNLTGTTIRIAGH